MPGSVLENVLGGVLGSIFRVCLGAYIKQAGSVPSSAIGSILESMSGSVLENVLGGVLGSVLRV